LVARAPSLIMNPTLPQKVVERARERDPQRVVTMQPPGASD